MKFIISPPYRRRRRATATYNFIPEDFWAKVGLTEPFRILSI